jgi:hypothetical protein
MRREVKAFCPKCCRYRSWRHIGADIRQCGCGKTMSEGELHIRPDRIDDGGVRQRDLFDPADEEMG